MTVFGPVALVDDEASDIADPIGPSGTGDIWAVVDTNDVADMNQAFTGSGAVGPSASPPGRPSCPRRRGSLC
ncbi:MAG: hypothetical protein ACR2G2_11765 [Pseudonocardia sp.]